MSNIEIMNYEDEVVDSGKELEIINSAAAKEMARIAGAELPTLEPKPKPKPEDNPGQKAESKADDNPENEKVEQKTYSIEDQVKQLFDENQKLRRALDTTNGRYGSELQTLRSRLESINTNPNINAIFEQINIDNPAFEELREEFPQLAESLVNGFRNALIGKAVKQQEQQEQQEQNQKTVIENAPSPQVEKQEIIKQDPSVNRLALERLNTNHPDFGEIGGYTTKVVAPGVVNIAWKNQEFGKWVESMPDEIREAIIVGGSTDNPTADQIFKINDILTEFKKTNTKQEEPDLKVKESRPKPDLSRSLLPDGRQQGKTISLTAEEIIEDAKKRTLKQVMEGTG
jgi:hypothetical protein